LYWLYRVDSFSRSFPITNHALVIQEWQIWTGRLPARSVPLRPSPATFQRSHGAIKVIDKQVQHRREHSAVYMQFGGFPGHAPLQWQDFQILGLETTEVMEAVIHLEAG
jgi:hypothetical protein